MWCKVLPFFPAGGSNHRGHSLLKQVSGPTQIDYVEDHPLIFLNIVDGEVKPEPDPGIAGVWTNEQVIFVLGDKIHSTKVALEKTRPGLRPFFCSSLLYSLSIKPIRPIIGTNI